MIKSNAHGINAVRRYILVFKTTSTYLNLNHFTFLGHAYQPILPFLTYCFISLLQSPLKIKISKVTFKDITGTSATQNGVVLICSSGVPCEEVVLSNIDSHSMELVSMLHVPTLNQIFWAMHLNVKLRKPGFDLFCFYSIVCLLCTY